MIPWRKHGLIYAPSGTRSWAQAYALLPTPIEIGPELVRVFYASLDTQRFGSIGFFDFDLRMKIVVNDYPDPCLVPGTIGTFDDSGVNPSSIIRQGNTLSLYYVGWQRSERVPYVLLGGLAYSTDGGLAFERYAQTPVFERLPSDPFIRSAPSVLAEHDGLRAWYVSASGWETIRGTLYPVYEIRHATSTDGRAWKPDDESCIKHQTADEFGFGRPWVVRDGSLYRMWYSVRSRTAPYKIGYAESADGINWQRRDDLAGISASSSGWDSEMICYAATIHVSGTWYMFYNGNRHGSTGIGLAIGG